MSGYDKNKSLFSIHIPKCGGSSLRFVLESWFGQKFFMHYYQSTNAPPQRIPAGPDTCIHGHFNRKRGIGLLDYYPEARQVITFLRDPFDASLSKYFYWKTKGRANQLKIGRLKEGAAHDYRSLDDFFCKRPHSHFLKFMPCPVTFENYREVIDRYFLYIGFLEDYQQSLEKLRLLLGYKDLSLGHINPAPRDETLSEDLRADFMKVNKLTYAVYHYAREKFCI